MGKIVLEDFNEGNGYYKVNLAYLNKEQVEEIENLVSKWNPTDEDIKSCIAMCLTDVNEQRFKDYGTNLRDCLAWLERQGEKIIPKDVDEAALQYVDTCPVNGEITHDNITEPYWNNHSMINAYKAGWLENQGEPNPYSGVSFKYNGHTWGMCARDNGVDILLDRQLIKHLEKQGEKKQDPCDNCDDKRLNCHNFPCVKKRAFKQGKSVLEAIIDEKVDNANKVEPHFKVGDTMRTLQEASNGITSGLPVVVSIDNEYYHCNNELIAIKDQDNYEYPPMNRRQKPSWSEEDENLLKASFENLTELKDMYGEEYGKVGDCISWLKSLKQRYTWKPSDEQLDALQYVYRNLNPPLSDKLGWNSLKTLELMYHDLKKLK